VEDIEQTQAMYDVSKEAILPSLPIQPDGYGRRIAADAVGDLGKKNPKQASERQEGDENDSPAHVGEEAPGCPQRVPWGRTTNPISH